MVNNICMRIKLTLLLLVVASSYASAQHRVNLNNWFLAANIGTTTGHMDVRPAGGREYLKFSEHFGYIISPEVSYHFTHGFGVVASWSWANVRSNEASKVEDGKYYREYNTNLNELKIMGHLNLGKALSFNKRKNIVSPFINAGAGSTWGRLKAPLSKIPGDWAGDYLEIDRLHNNRESDSANFQTWNKNIQLGFYWYLTRYIDLDIPSTTKITLTVHGYPFSLTVNGTNTHHSLLGQDSSLDQTTEERMSILHGQGSQWKKIPPYSTTTSR